MYAPWEFLAHLTMDEVVYFELAIWIDDTREVIAESSVGSDWTRIDDTLRRAFVNLKQMVIRADFEKPIEERRTLETQIRDAMPWSNTVAGLDIIFSQRLWRWGQFP